MFVYVLLPHRRLLSRRLLAVGRRAAAGKLQSHTPKLEPPRRRSETGSGLRRRSETGSGLRRRWDSPAAAPPRRAERQGRTTVSHSSQTQRSNCNK